jgi:hypothetical protein
MKKETRRYVRKYGMKLGTKIIIICVAASVVGVAFMLFNSNKTSSPTVATVVEKLVCSKCGIEATGSKKYCEWDGQPIVKSGSAIFGVRERISSSEKALEEIYSKVLGYKKTILEKKVEAKKDSIIAAKLKGEVSKEEALNLTFEAAERYLGQEEPRNTLLVRSDTEYVIVDYKDHKRTIPVWSKKWW